MGRVEDGLCMSYSIIVINLELSVIWGSLGKVVVKTKVFIIYSELPYGEADLLRRTRR